MKFKEYIGTKRATLHVMLLNSFCAGLILSMHSTLGTILFTINIVMVIINYRYIKDSLK